MLCCISHLRWKAFFVTICLRTQLWALHKLTRCPLHILKCSNNAKQTRFPSFSHPFPILFHLGGSRCAQDEAQHWAVLDVFNTDATTSSKENLAAALGIGPNTSEIFWNCCSWSGKGDVGLRHYHRVRSKTNSEHEWNSNTRHAFPEGNALRGVLRSDAHIPCTGSAGLGGLRMASNGKWDPSWMGLKLPSRTAKQASMAAVSGTCTNTRKYVPIRNSTWIH